MTAASVEDLQAVQGKGCVRSDASVADLFFDQPDGLADKVQ